MVASFIKWVDELKMKRYAKEIKCICEASGATARPLSRLPTIGIDTRGDAQARKQEDPCVSRHLSRLKGDSKAKNLTAEEWRDKEQTIGAAMRQAVARVDQVA